MRHLLSFISVLALFGAVITGCNHVPHYDSRLTTADSLMRTNPDSTLILLESLISKNSSTVQGNIKRNDGGSGTVLSTDHDLAYYNLLLTQSRYKAYITATSDSDINRALAYFSAHPADREKLTRAYIYKGAVMEELCHPDSAMFYYKNAEATAAPDDYFNLGYSNMRIAKLYQSLYTNDSAVLARMKMATDYFTIINDTNYLITTIGVQGALYDSDSAEHYLEKAIFLADAIKSPKKFIYQSKLAGYYFYKEDYTAAKNLAMDIILNGADECDESQFYYYAARSFIKLSCLDSAKYVFSIIPAPVTPIDSMNHFKLAADLAEAEHRYHDHALYLAEFKEINDRILTNSLESGIGDIEILYDAKTLNIQYRKSIFNIVFIIFFVIIFAALFAILWLSKRIKRRISEYQDDINLTRAELEKTIEMYEAKITENELSLAKQKVLLEEKDKKITIVTRENEQLISKQTVVEGQVSIIVRNRLAAIYELYNEIRVKTSNNVPYKRSMPLVSLLKDLNEKKKLSILTPKDSFWKKLRISIDDEYQGLATFVEQRYPFLTTKEYHLFLLLSAKISPQIIKLCMDFSHPQTVSNYKRKLIRDIMGHDMNFDEFIQSYLDGKLI